MYNHKRIPNKTCLKINKAYEGETIEQKVNRIVNNKEPIKDGAPIIYTERKQGVLPEHDIRTDRFEIAVEKMDYINKSLIAKRDHKIEETTQKTETPNNNSEAKPAQAT